MESTEIKTPAPYIRNQPSESLKTEYHKAKKEKSGVSTGAVIFAVFLALCAIAAAYFLPQITSYNQNAVSLYNKLHESLYKMGSTTSVSPKVTNLIGQANQYIESPFISAENKDKLRDVVLAVNDYGLLDRINLTGLNAYNVGDANRILGGISHKEVKNSDRYREAYDRINRFMFLKDHSKEIEDIRSKIYSDSTGTIAKWSRYHIIDYAVGYATLKREYIEGGVDLIDIDILQEDGSTFTATLIYNKDKTSWNEGMYKMRDSLRDKKCIAAIASTYQLSHNEIISYTYTTWNN